MIINDFNIKEIIAFSPKANPVLIIDPNAVLSLPVSIQLFQPVGRWDAQILQTSCIVDHNQLSQCDSLNILRELA